MKMVIHTLIIVFASSNFSYSQCDVNIIGNDFAWFFTCEGSAYVNVFEMSLL